MVPRFYKWLHRQPSDLDPSFIENQTLCSETNVSYNMRPRKREQEHQLQSNFVFIFIFFVVVALRTESLVGRIHKTLMGRKCDMVAQHARSMEAERRAALFSRDEDHVGEREEGP